MTTADWIYTAFTGSVWDIGQIDSATRKALDKLVKQKKLLKARRSWCGFGPTKTVWWGVDFDLNAECRRERACMLVAVAMDKMRREKLCQK